jgi:predicted Ser/Thr protein kinase
MKNIMNILHIEDVKYLAEGKRGIVYTGIYKKQKVAIKTKKPESLAKNRLKNEAKFLKILNKHKIGPKLLKSGKDYIIYKFIEGILLPEFLGKEENKKKKKETIIKILKQARTLDKLKINKLEFTRPTKHIFIKNSRITIIDFERSYYTDKPKNVTQFC